MTTCKRYFRNCNDFGICVNIGKKGYVLAEDPEERKTLFQYGVYGKGRFGKIFDSNYITFEGESGAKDAGRMRVEGKAYIVKDGDVMHFLFNA